MRLLIERSARRDFTRTLRVCVAGGDGPPLLWVERPYHVLKEDALLYADEAREHPLLAVRQKGAPFEGQTEHEIGDRDRVQSRSIDVDAIAPLGHVEACQYSAPAAVIVFTASLIRERRFADRCW